MIDDSRSNNGDRDKILATVAATVLEFFKSYPEATLLAKGSDPVKTRLYQMAINKKWMWINQFVIVTANHEDGWESFQPGKNYSAFMVRKR